MHNLFVNAKKLALSHKAASLVDCPRDEATLLSLANYGDMTHVQIVGARHAVPVFQGHCILRASIDSKMSGSKARHGTLKACATSPGRSKSLVWYSLRS